MSGVTRRVARKRGQRRDRRTESFLEQKGKRAGRIFKTVKTYGMELASRFAKRAVRQ